jgi:hypothetical protein
MKREILGDAVFDIGKYHTNSGKFNHHLKVINSLNGKHVGDVSVSIISFRAVIH